jgi:quinohemoprotein ethanol dehydrogenase
LAIAVLKYAVRGYFSANDAETGKMARRFDTVPRGPSEPFENPELAMTAPDREFEASRP